MLFFERADWGENAFLIHPQFRYRSKSNKAIGQDVDEFRLLCQSAGVIVCEEIICVRNAPDSKLFIGKGKAEEIALQLGDIEEPVVLVNEDLSPSQLRNLEKKFECRVVDRTGVILDIFAQRAKTYEGKLQVELAQLQHLSTRLVRGWTHLERQKGGIGLRGPGETQLEADRRMVRNQVENIRKRLDTVKKQRNQSRRSRIKTGQAHISFVGYTNAGKSSLFNKITHADILAKDQLFSTLDPSIRKVEFPQLGSAYLADTVGFVSNLPHTLVNAFRATLEEAANADLLVIVSDASDDEVVQHEKQAAVDEVLDEIGAGSIARLYVSNKIDKTELKPKIEYDGFNRPQRVWLSAHSGEGVDLFSEAIAECLVDNMVEKRLRLQPEESALRARFYQQNLVISEATDGDGICFLKVCGDSRLIDSLLNQYRRGSLSNAEKGL